MRRDAVLGSAPTPSPATFGKASSGFEPAGLGAKGPPETRSHRWTAKRTQKVIDISGRHLADDRIVGEQGELVAPHVEVFKRRYCVCPHGVA